MEIRTIPEIPFIGRDATKLYELEDLRATAIKKAAQELAEVLGYGPAEFWDRTMPEELCNILESYERPCAIAAAIGYLRQYGNINIEFNDGTKLEVPQRKAGAS